MLHAVFPVHHAHAWPDMPQGDVMLPNPGDLHFRHGGEGSIIFGPVPRWI